MNRSEFVRLAATQERMVISEIKKIVPDINPEDLQEVTQDVFLRAWEKREQYAPVAEKQTWLGAIARSVTKNWIESETREKREAIEYEHDLMSDAGQHEPYHDWDGAGYEPGADEVAEAEQCGRRIAASFDTLPEREQEVMRLAYQENCTAKEIAWSLSLSYDNVRQILARCRKFVTK